jgi:hypothetical protein
VIRDRRYATRGVLEHAGTDFIVGDGRRVVNAMAGSSGISAECKRDAEPTKNEDAHATTHVPQWTE